MSRRREWVWLLVVGCLTTASTASLAQPEEHPAAQYVRLDGEVREAWSAVETAGEAATPETRQNVIDAASALIEWLDAFFPTPQFGALSSDRQAQMHENRETAEYYRVVQLIHLGRCQEAHDRIRVLLAGENVDADLVPELAERYAEALECLTRARTATLEVSSTPADAEVLVDGVFVGLATAAHEVEAGAHQVLIRATGYVAHEVEIEAAEGEVVTVLGIELAAVVEDEVIPPPPAVKMPLWYEWTLWGVGAAGITTSLVSFLNARAIEDQIDSPPDGFHLTDPDAEQSEIDQRDTLAVVAGGIGIVSAVVGTVLFITRDANDVSSATVWNTVRFSFDGIGVWVQF